MSRGARMWTVAGLAAVAASGLVLPGAWGVPGTYAWLGIFPGMALVRLLLPRADASTRWTLGIALSPIVAAWLAWALVLAGLPLVTAARLIGIGTWILFAGGEARSEPGDARESGAPATRWAWGWAIGSALFVAMPPLVNEGIRVRSDTWVHAGIVWEIVLRGLPPQDPRFAGLPLHYVWFYNLFVALLTSLRSQDVFACIAVSNVVWMGALVWLAWQLGWCLWRDHARSRGVLPLFVLGLNAGAVLLWPLWLVRALRGSVRGMAEVRRILANAHWTTSDVQFQLSAPFAHAVITFWDKFTLGTALGYAYVLMLLHLWSFARAWESSRSSGAPSRSWLVVAALSVAGAMFVHSIIGVAVASCSLGACALALLFARRFPWLGSRRLMLEFAMATLLGVALSLPYFRSISGGRAPGAHVHYLHLGVRMAWTLVTACGIAAALAIGPVRQAIAGRRGEGGWILLWALGMLAFGLFVHLPENNEIKFVFALFVPLAMFGGAALPGALASARARLGSLATGAALLLVGMLPSVLFLVGFVLDPSGPSNERLDRAAGFERLVSWVGDSTDVHSVFVDGRSRDVLLARGRRRLLAGTPLGPELAAFPADELAHRRAVTDDLLGAGARLADDAGFLRSLGAPAYVLVRSGDGPVVVAAGERLQRDSTQFAVRYDRDGFRVFEVRR